MKPTMRNMLALGLLGVMLPLSHAAGAQTRTFALTLTNLTSGQPFSAPLFATHDATESVWNVGDTASYGLKQLAEEGDNSSLAFDLSLASGSVGTVLAASDPLAPGKSATYTLTTDAAHPLLSSAWMLAFTNDGFSGTQGSEFNLFGAQGGGIYDLIAYDAGTEVNNELADYVPALGGHFEDPEDGVITVHPGILGVGDIDQTHDFSGPVARLSIQAVPEPGLLTLLIGGLALSGMMARRARQARR